MINTTNFTVSDNTIVVNGTTFKVSDTVATKIMQLILGIGQTASTTDTVVEQPTTFTTVDTVAKKEKAVNHYSGKDLNLKFEVTKRISTDGKRYFCINRKCGWTKVEKTMVNDTIKALDGIITIKVPKENNGGTYTAWGFKTKKEALEKMATLPLVIKKEDINAMVDKIYYSK